MLKMISKNSEVFYGSVCSQGLQKKYNPLQIYSAGSVSEPLFFDIKEISSNLYVCKFHDLSHGLACELHLELKHNFLTLDVSAEEDSHLTPVITGDFPYINVQKLNEKVLGDDYLQAMVLIQFQLKILEQLMLFCDDSEATHLILNFNEANLDYLEIYQQFLLSERDVMTSRGEQTQIIISSDAEVFDELVDFMDNFERDCRQVLWQDQNSNPTFRHYLKAQSVLAC